jgi:hypothetical protein
VRMVRWMRRSMSASMLLVASSRSTMRDRRRRALRDHICMHEHIEEE